MEEDIFMKYNDGKDRCSWANPKNLIYIDYHDKEWGVPVYDDHKLFEINEKRSEKRLMILMYIK